MMDGRDWLRPLIDRQKAADGIAAWLRSRTFRELTADEADALWAAVYEALRVTPPLMIDLILHMLDEESYI